MRGTKELTICFDEILLTGTLITWLHTIAAEIKEGDIAEIHFPETTQIRQITPRQFRIFEPGIAGEMVVGLELSVYETTVSFSWGGPQNATTRKPE